MRLPIRLETALFRNLSVNLQDLFVRHTDKYASAQSFGCRALAKNGLFLVLIVGLILGMPLLIATGDAASQVVEKEDKTYIVDRTGGWWDVSQATSIGFNPEGFQYGLGKDAFTPLDDRSLTSDQSDVPAHLRVIGIAEGDDAKAYAVPTLRGHEIANSHIGEKPIAAAY